MQRSAVQHEFSPPPDLLAPPADSCCESCLNLSRNQQNLFNLSFDKMRDCYFGKRLTTGTGLVRGELQLWGSALSYTKELGSSWDASLANIGELDVSWLL